MRFLGVIIYLIALSVELANATFVPSGSDAPPGKSNNELALTLLDSVASSLNQWGSKSQGSELRKLKLEHVLNSGESLTALRLRGKANQVGEFAVLFLAVTVLITCLSFICACFGRWWDEDEMTKPDPTMAALDFYTSPWAIAYRDSEGQQRKAIELLFKCNIVTMPEFANDYAVSHQHSDIYKCVSIGESMLQEHPSSDWEARWQEAQQIFDQKAADFYGSARIPT